MNVYLYLRIHENQRKESCVHKIAYRADEEFCTLLTTIYHPQSETEREIRRFYCFHNGILSIRVCSRPALRSYIILCCVPNRTDSITNSVKIKQFTNTQYQNVHRFTFKLC